MSEGISLIVPLIRPLHKYEGSITVNLRVSDWKIIGQIRIPVSGGKDFSIVQKFLAEKNLGDLVNTANIPDANVSWENAIKIIQNFIIPLPLSEIFLNKEQFIELNIMPKDVPQTYLLAKAIGMENFISFLVSSLYSLDFEDSLVVMNTIDAFIRSSERLAVIRMPIVNNIATNIMKNNDLIKNIFKPCFSYAVMKLQEKIQASNDFAITWLLNIYPLSEEDAKYYKGNIVRILYKLRNCPFSDYLIWCYSFCIEEISRPKNITFNDAMRNVAELENGKEFITNAMIYACKEEKTRVSVMNNLPKKEFIEFRGTSTEDLIILLQALFKEKKECDFVDFTIDEIKKREDSIEIANKKLDLSLFPSTIITELFQSSNPEFIEILYKWTLLHQNEIDNEFADLFYKSIPKENCEKIPLYLLLSLDCFNRLKVPPKAPNPPYDRITPTLLGDGLKQAMEYDSFPINPKTIRIIHNCTHSDFYSHSLLIQFIEKFKIIIKKPEMLPPFTETTLPTSIEIISRCKLQVGPNIITRMLKLMSITLDSLSYSQIEVIGNCIMKLKLEERDECIKLINECTFLSCNEAKVAYLGEIINERSFIRVTHIPLKIVAEMEKISVDFQFSSEEFPRFTSLSFITSEWCDLQPARSQCIPQARALIPSSVCVLIFAEHDVYPSEIMLKSILEFSGIFNITTVNCSECKPADLPQSRAYILWKPTNSKVEFLYREWLDALKGKPFCVSATIIKEDPAALLSGIRHNYDDMIDKIEWGAIDECLLPFKSELFTLSVNEDDLFGSIPFTIMDKRGISAEVTFKNGREFSLSYSDKHIGIFNFDLIPNLDAHGIFSYAAAKIASKSIAALLCEVSVI